MRRLLQRSGLSRLASVITVLAIAASAAVTLSSTGGAASAADSVSNSLGVYAGYQSPGVVGSFGQAVGTKPAFAMDFLDGDSWSSLVNTAPSYMSAWKGTGFTMIWGLPMLPNSGSTLAQGAAGNYDSNFLQIAQDMVAGGQADAIIRPGWEFNGGWFPWAAGGQAANFVAYLAADRDDHAVGAGSGLHVRVEPDGR